MKIAYGVSGEGLGHATRSAAVVAFLERKGHEVILFSSGRSHEYLNKRFKSVKAIQNIPLKYEKGKVALLASTMLILRTNLIKSIPTIRKLKKQFREEKIDIVISDYEFYTTIGAKVCGLPLISANNISLPFRSKVKEPKGQFISRVFTRITERLATFKADQYIIPTYARGQAKKNVKLTDIVVRPQFRKIKPTKGEHLVIYQTTATNTSLLLALKKTDEKCFIYGYGSRKKQGNLTFEGFDEKKFIKHLKSAKAVILGGGHSSISEALYLKKPILCVPVAKQYEQMLNGFMIKEKGFGSTTIEVDEKVIREFCSQLDIYQKNLDQLEIDPEQFEREVLLAAQQLVL